MVAVGREIWRVLRDDGTFWCNLGDSYSTHHFTRQGKQRNVTQAQNQFIGTALESRKSRIGNTVVQQHIPGLKPKDLCGIPWRVALALQADGWYLRSEIIWAKLNPMPESVTDRPTKAHETVFLLTKQPRYFYDADAVRERGIDCDGRPRGKRMYDNHTGPISGGGRECWSDKYIANPAGRNRRTVWTIATQPYSGAHFATFPEKLVEPMIKAGTSERGCCPECGAGWKRVVERKGVKPGDAKNAPTGYTKAFDKGFGVKEGHGYDGMGGGPVRQAWLDAHPKVTIGFTIACNHNHDPIPCTVLDPFCGSGTAGVVARRLGRHFVGLDLSAEYLQLARTRLGLTALDAWNAGKARVVEDSVDGLPLFDKEMNDEQSLLAPRREPRRTAGPA